MTQPVSDQLNVFLHDGDKTMWSTAAVVLAIHGVTSDEEQAAAHAVLEASGVDGLASLGPEAAGALAAPAAAPSIRSPPSCWTRDRREPRNRTRRSSPKGGRAPGAPPPSRTREQEVSSSERLRPRPAAQRSPSDVHPATVMVGPVATQEAARRQRCSAGPARRPLVNPADRLPDTRPAQLTAGLTRK
jgi:hypothetical protein